MLVQGVEVGRWTSKFVYRVQLKGDLVTASPDIYQVTLASDAEFLLLASDGLWDYVNSLDAVTFVRNQPRTWKCSDPAESYSISILLVIFLSSVFSVLVKLWHMQLWRTDWENLAPQQQNFVWELSQAFATISIVSLGIG
ncbi:hypothetical protein IFM89_034254 [Coptis chinensis]|uniref:PPM-type phosphatase domain-containing protein n=1 Tax=Coptis chinensis TaxID=261450 RepID=A0A835HAD2_9MAGN|nr:hypothetical protein IFM89_034254 [Coptis chinensis]